MTYFSSSLIALLLYFFELSLFPHFSPWLTIPFLLLPFFSILSVKDRTIFPIILAAIFGFLMDASVLSNFPIFVIAFVAITAISKLFFARFVSYGEMRATLLLTLFGLLIIYGFELPLSVTTLSWSFSWLIPIIFNFLLTYLVLAIMFLGFGKYFDWVEKSTEERFR
jgi:hypothetical protein